MTAESFTGAAREAAQQLLRRERRLRRTAFDLLRRYLRSPKHVIVKRLARGAGQALAEERAIQEIKRTLRRARSGDGPILIGPWLSEVGFELLYWIPFLNWALEQFEIDKRRILVVSRGGVREWYGNIAARYVDVFELITPEEFRLGNERRWAEIGGQKQLLETQFEKEIVGRVGESLGCTFSHVIHPALMYRLFRAFWSGRTGAKLVEKFTRYAFLPGAGATRYDQSRKPYVAVRFYFRPSFPDTSQNRNFVKEVIGRLSRARDVVVLSNDLRMDDHSDCLPSVDSSRVTVVGDGVSADSNLRLQTEIIRNADLFVGTYGGLAYLAPFCGVPSASFFSDPTELQSAHLDVAMRVFNSLGIGFVALRTGDADLLGSFS